MSKREIWLTSGIFIALIIGLIGGWILNEKQLWFWGIKHDQAQIRIKIKELDESSQRIQNLLRAWGEYAEEIDELCLYTSAGKTRIRIGETGPEENIKKEKKD